MNTLDFPAITKFCLTDTTRRIIIFLSLIIFRIFIVQYSSIEDNGYFQSIYSISNYLNVILTAFLVFLFPTLSSIMETERFNREINIYFEYLLYVIFPFAAVIMLFPDIFLRLLFTEEFMIMSYPLVILVFTKVGDAVYLFYTTAFLAQTKLRAFIISEMTRGILLVLLSYFAIRAFGLDGAIGSFILMIIISLGVVLYFVAKSELFRLSRKNVKLFIHLSLISACLLVPGIEQLWARTLQIIVFSGLVLLVLDIKKYFQLIKLFLPESKQNNSDSDGIP